MIYHGSLSDVIKRIQARIDNCSLNLMNGRINMYVATITCNTLILYMKFIQCFFALGKCSK